MLNRGDVAPIPLAVAICLLKALDHGAGQCLLPTTSSDALRNSQPFHKSWGFFAVKI